MPTIDTLLNPLPFFSGEILCPDCCWNYVHPVGVEVYPLHGTTKLSITAQGVVEEPCEPGDQRGIAIVLDFAGECGHRWNVVFQFHKGNTLIKYVPVPNDERGWDTIWRD